MKAATVVEKKTKNYLVERSIVSLNSITSIMNDVNNSRD